MINILLSVAAMTLGKGTFLRLFVSAPKKDNNNGNLDK